MGDLSFGVPFSERTDSEIIEWVFRTAIFFGCSVATAGIVAQHFIDGIRADREPESAARREVEAT